MTDDSRTRYGALGGHLITSPELKVDTVWQVKVKHVSAVAWAILLCFFLFFFSGGLMWKNNGCLPVYAIQLLLRELFTKKCVFCVIYSLFTRVSVSLIVIIL